MADRLRVHDPQGQSQHVVKEGNRISFFRTSNRPVELNAVTDSDTIVDVDYRVKGGRVGIMTRYADRAGCHVLIRPPPARQGGAAPRERHRTVHRQGNRRAQAGMRVRPGVLPLTFDPIDDRVFKVPQSVAARPYRAWKLYESSRRSVSSLRSWQMAKARL